jgi:hypothetical protein
VVFNDAVNVRNWQQIRFTMLRHRVFKSTQMLRLNSRNARFLIENLHEWSISSAQPRMTVLIVGAYGLIGCGVAQRLERDGHTIIGLGRNINTGKRVLPTLN